MWLTRWGGRRSVGWEEEEGHFRESSLSLVYVNTVSSLRHQYQIDYLAMLRHLTTRAGQSLHAASLSDKSSNGPLPRASRSNSSSLSCIVQSRAMSQVMRHRIDRVELLGGSVCTYEHH